MSDTISAFYGIVPLVDIDVLKQRDLTTGLQVRGSIPGYSKKVFLPNIQIASGVLLDSCTGYCGLFPGG